MAKRSRALLTDHDRDVYAGEVDVPDSTVYEKNSRVRTRITDELTEDLELLSQANPDLYLELLEVVLDHATGEEMLSILEQEQPELATKLALLNHQ